VPWVLRSAKSFPGCSLYVVPHRDYSGKVPELVVQTSDSLWDELRFAGEAEYDRFWRMPLDEDYGPQIHSSNADLCNVNVASFDCHVFLDTSYALDWWQAGRLLHRCDVPEVIC
jgi:hypothetical protein